MNPERLDPAMIEALGLREPISEAARPAIGEVMRRRHAAAWHARNLIASLALDHPDQLDIELIAAHCGAYVVYRALAHEEGHLLRRGDTGLIVVADRARATNKWRFVIAHELGHFLLHDAPAHNQIDLCTEIAPPGGASVAHEHYAESGLETEANVFAGELLMPTALIAPHCRASPSLEPIKTLATLFRTSLTATAIRFSEMCAVPTAVVHSTNGTIDWVRAHRKFGGGMEAGRPLAPGSRAAELLASGVTDAPPALMPARTWSDDPGALYEHSMVLQGFDSVLTLLWRA